MRKNPQEKLQEGLLEPTWKGQRRVATHEPANAAWIQKGSHTGKSSKKPIGVNSNTSHESKQDILGFHTGLFGNSEDVQNFHQGLPHTNIFERDRSSSNIRMDSVPQTIDGNVSFIYIDQVHISDPK